MVGNPPVRLKVVTYDIFLYLLLTFILNCWDLFGIDIIGVAMLGNPPASLWVVLHDFYIHLKTCLYNPFQQTRFEVYDLAKFDKKHTKLFENVLFNFHYHSKF